MGSVGAGPACATKGTAGVAVNTPVHVADPVSRFVVVTALAIDSSVSAAANDITEDSRVRLAAHSEQPMDSLALVTALARKGLTGRVSAHVTRATAVPIAAAPAERH